MHKYDVAISGSTNNDLDNSIVEARTPFGAVAQLMLDHDAQERESGCAVAAVQDKEYRITVQYLSTSEDDGESATIEDELAVADELIVRLKDRVTELEKELDAARAEVADLKSSGLSVMDNSFFDIEDYTDSGLAERYV